MWQPRLDALNTAKVTGDAHGNVKQLHAVRVGPPPKFEAMSGTELVMDVDLVLLALGFTGPVKQGHDRAVWSVKTWIRAAAISPPARIT